MTNDAVQSEFITYLNINPSAPSVTPSFGLMPSDAVSQPCSSFGYASVSLGRALFAQYAEERLAKRAVERFFRGHLERAPEGRRHETLIVERAERRKEVFFEATGLWEQGSGHNQVLDALREIAAKKSALDGVAEEMRHELGKSRRSLAPSAWLESFTTAFDALVERFEAAERERIHGTAMTWVREVQPRVLGAVADAIGRDGLPVAELLLDLLIQQVRDAAEELRAAGVRFSGEERGLLNLTKGLFLLGEKVITSNHQALDKATTHRRDALQRRTEGDLYTFTARLLDDIADNFLDVLRGTLQRLQPALRADVEGEYGTRVRQWSARAVPPHLTSAPNEILLEPQDAFPSRLDALLAQLFEGEGEDEAESHAVQEIITGAWPSVDAESGEATAQDLFHIRAWWAPANTLARPGSAPANIASVTADIGVDGIQAAAARWVRRRRGALTGFIDASLGEWLSPDQPDAAQRATRFVSSLDLALKAAEPLVSVNATTHQAVHGGRPPEPSVIISPIPLATDHRAYPQVSALLKSAGMTEGNLAGAFASNALGGQVEVSTFLGHAVHPVVMDSVFTPVQRAWQSADRRRFWEFRRARQIPSFVPLSPAYQRKLVRGWLAANMLGHVPPLTVPWSVAPLSVWAPDGRRPFPKHLLGGDVRTGVGILPALMESLPLALLSFAGNDTSELSAYVRLIELGGDDPMLADLTPPAGPELVAWVLRGEVTTALDGHEGAPTPAREVAGTAAGTSAERASALSGTLRDFAEQYRTVIGGRPVTRDSTLAIGAEWEVRGLVVGAATDLAAAVEAVTAAAASGTTGPTNLTI
jgi:hypothetical protein